MHVARILARNRRQTDFADLTFHEALRPVSATVRFRNSRKFVPHSTDRGQALCRILSRARHSFPGCPCWNRLRIPCTAGATLTQPSLAPVGGNFPSGIPGKKHSGPQLARRPWHTPGGDQRGQSPSLPPEPVRHTPRPRTNTRRATFCLGFGGKSFRPSHFPQWVALPSRKPPTPEQSGALPPSGSTPHPEADSPPPKKTDPVFATQQPKSEDPYTQTLHWLG